MSFNRNQNSNSFLLSTVYYMFSELSLALKTQHNLYNFHYFTKLSIKQMSLLYELLTSTFYPPYQNLVFKWSPTFSMKDDKSILTHSLKLYATSYTYVFPQLPYHPNRLKTRITYTISFVYFLHCKTNRRH